MSLDEVHLDPASVSKFHKVDHGGVHILTSRDCTLHLLLSDQPSAIVTNNNRR
jgi:hypothetical protein